MNNLRTLTKAELLKLLESVPDAAPILVLSSVQDVGRALANTASTTESKDQSEVVMAIEGPLAYDSKTGVHYIVAGHLPVMPG